MSGSPTPRWVATRLGAGVVETRDGWEALIACADDYCYRRISGESVILERTTTKHAGFDRIGEGRAETGTDRVKVKGLGLT